MSLNKLDKTILYSYQCKTVCYGAIFKAVLKPIQDGGGAKKMSLPVLPL